jgi:regulator of protease activity HflC (stomatin/prohibitin superfamily)
MECKACNVKHIVWRSESQAASSEQLAVSREQRAESREQRAERQREREGITK